MNCEQKMCQLKQPDLQCAPSKHTHFEYTTGASHTRDVMTHASCIDGDRGGSRLQRPTALAMAQRCKRETPCSHAVQKLVICSAVC